MAGNDGTRLTVLSVAYPFAPVGFDAVGGSEQILSLVDRALVNAGHTSLVAACEGSRPAGRLISIPLLERELLEQPERSWYTAQLKAAIDRALQLYRVDLVHMHGLDFYEYDLPPGLPVLVTLHLPVAWYGAERLRRLQSRVQLCCVSESQRRSCPAELRDLPVVENGVALPPRQAGQKKSNYALVLGRICPEKNVHAALEAGSLANTRVLVGGRAFPYLEHQAYFEAKVEPLLQARQSAVRHKFLGPVGAAQRETLLAQARCLLHPTLAPETSSLVAMEALAAGTPVIAYRSGALPDIVEDGVTGFLVDSVEEMAKAIRHVDEISPEACRRAAEKRFPKERMVDKYFDLYHALVGGCGMMGDRALAREHALEKVYA
jgi:glycosyltransferase involved in cell wall biosynthesis